MEDRKLRCSRRKFLAQAAALTVTAGLPPGSTAAETTVPGAFRARPPRPGRDGRRPIAVIATVYRPLSHAQHIAGRFVHGYTREGRFHVPRQYVHALYVEQTPENDLSRELGRDFGVRVTRSIADALTGGGDRLATTRATTGARSSTRATK